MRTPVRRKIVITYEVFMALLALISVAFIWQETDTAFVQNIDYIIWIIFVVDVGTRFAVSKNKWQYIKSNPLDIIAIIPLDSIFRLARLARFFRVLRSLAVLRHYMAPLYAILRTNHLDRMILATVILIFGSSLVIYQIEDTIPSYADGVWWAVVTATTVGYGDLSPETTIGRLIAVILMIFGIGLLGTVTSAVAAFFMNKKETARQEETDEAIMYLKRNLDQIAELSNEEIERMKLMLETYKKDNSN